MQAIAFSVPASNWLVTPLTLTNTPTVGCVKLGSRLAAETSDVSFSFAAEWPLAGLGLSTSDCAASQGLS